MSRCRRTWWSRHGWCSNEDYDPDELLGYTQAYAGQVSALDECLAWTAGLVAERPWAASTLLAVVGSRGLALGEHRRVGCWDEALCGELLHVPMVRAIADGTGRGRSQPGAGPARRPGS